jgi:hypothetical protein
MGEAFIVRKGGVAEEVLRTTNPSINFVSKTESQIVVTFTNNDATEADVFYGLTSPLTTKVTLATATTSSNITFSGLDQNTQYTISAYAIVTDATLKKIKSEIISTSITTDAVIYTAATGGTTAEYDSGGKRYKSHTFTSDGTFTVTQVGDATDDRNKVDYLIIAGGGGGGSRRGSGGGAGGYQTTISPAPSNDVKTKVVVTAQGYSITVGSGGAGGATGSNNGSNGTNSSGLGITSTGGGGGSWQAGVGGNGGSGGGSNGEESSPGTGISGQGFGGGTGKTSESFGGAGGGGASQVGQDGNFGSNIAGAGGNGLANTLRDGTSETRAGGGGGGNADALGTSGNGGTGGGGNGAINAVGQNGTANTGSGGGGGGLGPSPSYNVSYAGGSGADGIVVIRYEIAPSV